MASKARLTPKVGAEVFIATSWTCTTVALAFLIFRLFVRLHSFKRLYADDYLVIAAWLMILATSITWQIQKDALYDQYNLAAGKTAITPQFASQQETLSRATLAIVTMFYCSLWSVKLSFLLFFRRLDQNVKGHRVWWWCVLTFTVATWASCIGDIQYQCLVKPFEWIARNCSSGYQLSFQWVTFSWNCAADVLSDVTIITLPIIMLWNVRIPRPKKIALMALFSITVIVIIVSIIRVAVVTSKTTQADVTWLHLWSLIEMAVGKIQRPLRVGDSTLIYRQRLAVIVACLASFRQLFVMSGKRMKRTPEQQSQFSVRCRGLLSGSRSQLSKTLVQISSVPHKARKFFGTSHGESQRSWAPQSTDRIIPLDRVTVDRGAEISFTPLQGNTQACKGGTHETRCYAQSPHSHERVV
ncbi:MAG: hypothetical protein Q9216_005882 [Gyalolechia sp. 2 TL-2023]